MSFRCVECGKSQKNGIKPIMIVVERRSKNYPIRYGMRINRQTKQEERVVVDKGGSGWEAVREIQVCSSCAEENAPVLEKVDRCG